MLKNYILIAWRNLLRYKLISCINIIGLAISISIGLLVLGMVKKAFDVDSFHPEPDRTYRIITKQFLKSGSAEYYATSPFGLVDYLQQNYPFIEHATRIIRGINEPVKAQIDGEEFNIESVFADSAFFNVFGLKLDLGDPLRAFNEPYTAVISTNTAIQLFGKQDPMGKTLTMGKYGEFTITGVVEKPKLSSRVAYQIYLSMPTLPSLIQAGQIGFPVGWEDATRAYTYVMVKEGVKINEIKSALRNASGFAMRNAVLHPVIDHREFQAQSISNLVYSPTLWFEARGARTVPYFPLAISILMLLLAAFNYMNLTIAKVFSRVREIGIRKVSGATQRHLMGQFVIEAVLIALISFGFALFLTKLIPLNGGMSHAVAHTVDLTLFTWFLLFAIVVGVVCGVFPAVALSKVKLTTALKNKIIQGDVRTPFWQKALIVIQFSVSLLFITVSLVLLGQTRFISGADYGINRSDILNIPVHPADVQYFKNLFNQETSVQRVSASSGRPVFSRSSDCWVYNQTDSMHVFYFAADEHFVPVYGLSIIAGENFSDKMPVNHETSVMINEEAVLRFGFATPHDAIGESISIGDTTLLKITGVFRDFHVQGLKHPIIPFLLRYLPGQFNMLTLKTKPGEMDFVIAKAQEISKKANRDYPLEYSVFENEFYRDDFIYLDDLKMIGYLSFVTVLISSLGLIGIVMYNSRARASEIGIRKVMGASVSQITVLISKQFVMLLLISCTLALPVGYVTSNAMLQEFTYRIHPGILLYVSGVSIMMTIGLVVICSQTIYAALRNPVEIIRSE